MKLPDLTCAAGELARPFALYAIAGSCAWGVVSAGVAADKLGLALAALGAMYGAKAYEAHGAVKANAAVEIAKAGAGQP